jgi:hypothetical protein
LAWGTLQRKQNYNNTAQETTALKKETYLREVKEYIAGKEYTDFLYLFTD